MERSSLVSICNQVYRKFPEMSGVQPKVTTRPDNQFLLVFKTSVAVADGRSLPRAVRVVASAEGKILKMTTSH
jgi:hypothetical protein